MGTNQIPHVDILSKPDPFQLEALSREFSIGVSWELHYTEDLLIIADSLEECIARIEAWKAGIEKKG